MPTYLITNRVPADFTGSAAAFAAWTAWFEKLGPSLADRGNPAFKRTTLGDCGASTVLGGYTLISADDLEAAVGLAREHPLVGGGFGGGVEVAELTLLNEGRHLIADREVAVSVHLAAAPEDVFPYLTDPARYVQWMGSSAILDPVPGGSYSVRMNDGFAAAGTFVEVEQPHRVAFTWGWADGAAEHTLHQEAAADGAQLAPGSTRVIVTLTAEDGGTCLELRHCDLPTAELRDGHRIAWETYLDRLSTRIADGDPGPDPHS